VSGDSFAQAIAAQLAGRLLAVAVVDTEIAALLRLPGVEPADRAIAMLERLHERAIAYGIDPDELDLPKVDRAVREEIARLEGRLALRRLGDGDG
jgi:hypothetical protein